MGERNDMTGVVRTGLAAERDQTDINNTDIINTDIIAMRAARQAAVELEFRALAGVWEPMAAGTPAPSALAESLETGVEPITRAWLMAAGRRGQARLRIAGKWAGAAMQQADKAMARGAIRLERRLRQFERRAVPLIVHTDRLCMEAKIAQQAYLAAMTGRMARVVRHRALPNMMAMAMAAKTRAQTMVGAARAEIDARCTYGDWAVLGGARRAAMAVAGFAAGVMMLAALTSGGQRTAIADAVSAPKVIGGASAANPSWSAAHSVALAKPACSVAAHGAVCYPRASAPR